VAEAHALSCSAIQGQSMDHPLPLALMGRMCTMETKPRPQAVTRGHRKSCDQKPVGGEALRPEGEDVRANNASRKGLPLKNIVSKVLGG